MGYYRELRQEEAKKKIEAEIVARKKELPEYEQRIKAVSENLQKNNTKSNRRSKMLMLEEVERLNIKIEELKVKANETK